MELPPLPLVLPRDRLLLERKRALERAWRSGPYHLPLPTAEAQKWEVERYSDRHARAPPGRENLREFLTLLPDGKFPEGKYFPSELWEKPAGAGRQGTAAKRGAGAGRALVYGHVDDALAAERRLDALAAAERRAEGGGGGAGDAARRKRRARVIDDDDDDGGESGGAAKGGGGGGGSEEDEEEGGGKAGGAKDARGGGDEDEEGGGGGGEAEEAEEVDGALGSDAFDDDDDGQGGDGGDDDNY